MKSWRRLQVSAAVLVGYALAAGLLSAGIFQLPDIMVAPWARLNALLSGWFMHLIGMHVWVDYNIIHTDLYRYAIHAGYHGTGVALSTIILAITIAALRHYNPFETVFMIAASLITALIINVLRITLIIHFGSPPDAVAASGLLEDTTIIITALAALSVCLNMLIVTAAKIIRFQKREPLPGTVEGTLSEYPPFWHRVLRRYRPVYLLIPVIAAIAAITYAGRPSRREAILAKLVLDMSAQGAYDHALRLGQQLAANRQGDLDWQLRLIRIMLLDRKTQLALQSLDALPPREPQPHHKNEINLLQTYAYLLQQDWEQARATFNKLQEHADTDPVWHMIFLEIALALGDQEQVIALVPEATRAFHQLGRIGAALPMLASSGNWDIFLTATPWIDRENTPLSILTAQVMAQLHLDRTSAAAEHTQFGLQHWPDSLELLPAVLILTQASPAEWEPRLAQMLMRITRNSENPRALFAVISAAFVVYRPDLAWPAYQKLREHDQQLYADLALAKYAAQWFLFRNHFLRLPATTPAITTQLAPWLLLGQHLPFLHKTTDAIPYARHTDALLDPEAWQRTRRNQIIADIAQGQHLSRLDSNPELRLLVASLLEDAHKYEEAYLQLEHLAQTHPAITPLTDYHLARLDLLTGNNRKAFERLRTVICDADALALDDIDIEKNWPPRPIRLKPQTAHQLPLLIALIELQWENRQFITATFTMREALRRFPHDPVIRTLAGDILLQIQRPEQALLLLQNTTIRRLPVTDELESDALLATGRHAALRTFRRQRLLPPLDIPPDASPPDRLPPAEELFAPVNPDDCGALAPRPDDPIFSLFQQVLHDPAQPIDWEAWLTTPQTRLEQAEAMFRLYQLLYTQKRLDSAQQAARYAVIANPHEPLLWLHILKTTSDRANLLAYARSFCPDDPDLWLADLVWTAHMPHEQKRTRKLDRLIKQAREEFIFPVETLVRAADFLWRGHDHANAQHIISLFHQHERGLLAAHLLGVEAAEWAGNRGRALYNIEAAIEAASQTMPELYARFIKSKLRDGVIESDGNIVNALRELQHAEPDNILWMELLGYIRYQRGGAEVMEASQMMRAAIRAGSTNRVAFIIAAEGLRRVNRTHEAAQILQQGLAGQPHDPVMLNNLAYLWAENPSTAPEATNLIPALIPFAEQDPEIRDTLAFVLLRNNELESARELLARNLREMPPDSRIWFRSQMHLAEIVWRQGRTQIATSMLEQLLRGARNIPDEDILTANRLLMRIVASP
ncbi:MAG: archaeosortase/exosortase family protein [Kiritimatiellia bacterium]